MFMISLHAPSIRISRFFAIAAVTLIAWAGPWTPASAVDSERLEAGTAFRDCPNCPLMIVVPAGRFRMGTPDDEYGREFDEGPRHTVEIDYDFAVGKFEITRREFAAFVEDTGHAPDDACFIETGRDWQVAVTWRSPGYAVSEDHPVVCVSWTDARAYVDWLSLTTGKPYRLLSEAEWEYAARARSPGATFDTGARSVCAFANALDQQAARTFNGIDHFLCTDGYVYAAPVGTFIANEFGLNDTLGNVLEWVEDCWHDHYDGAPDDGSAWQGGTCAGRVLRGGSWYYAPRHLRLGNREWDRVQYQDYDIGFRVARDLPNRLEIARRRTVDDG